MADSFVLPLEVTLCGMRREGSILVPLKSENLWSMGVPPSVLAGEDPVSPSLGEASRVFLLAFSCTVAAPLMIYVLQNHAG